MIETLSYGYSSNAYNAHNTNMTGIICFSKNAPSFGRVNTNIGVILAGTGKSRSHIFRRDSESMGKRRNCGTTYWPDRTLTCKTQKIWNLTIITFYFPNLLLIFFCLLFLLFLPSYLMGAGSVTQRAIYWLGPTLTCGTK